MMAPPVRIVRAALTMQACFNIIKRTIDLPLIVLRCRQRCYKQSVCYTRLAAWLKVNAAWRTLGVAVLLTLGVRTTLCRVPRWLPLPRWHRTPRTLCQSHVRAKRMIINN